MIPLSQPMPAENIPASKAPGHWVLARLDKRILRPGGLALTRKMMQALNIGPTDKVVEFAPGLGVTAKMALEKKPARYTAIEREPVAAEQVRQYLNDKTQTCITASAQKTGLADQCATVVYGEAMLSMQPDGQKFEIMREAARLLPAGGQYAIHELSLVKVTPELQESIHEALCRTLHVGATPLTQEQWVYLLAQAGFKVTQIFTAPMALLEPVRIMRDEGLLQSLRFFFNLALHPEAYCRIAQMRAIFQKYKNHLSAIVIIAEKQAGIKNLHSTAHA